MVSRAAPWITWIRRIWVKWDRRAPNTSELATIPNSNIVADPVDGIPGPDGLAPGRYDNPYVASRDVPVDGAPTEPALARRAWFHVTEPLPADDPALHQHALAYLSDHGPTRAAREPHVHLADDARRQSVSLDHSVWFHRPAHVNQWLLSELVPVATARSRGLAIGTLRTADGTLVATVAQEVLLRTR